MIIQCEKCRTKFNIDETALMDQGSKVRCSRCKHIFTAYPPEQTDAEDMQTLIFSEEEMGTTGGTSEAGLEEEMGFDAIFEEESMEDIEDLEAGYVDDSLGFLQETNMEGAFIDDSQETADKETQDEAVAIKAVFKKKESRKIGKLLVFFVIILGLIGAAYGVTQWMPRLVPDFLNLLIKKPDEKPKDVDPGASRLEILTTEYSFVDTQNAGRVFVIRGKVRNNYPKSRSFILVKGAILDIKGEVLKEKAAYAGNAFGEKELLALSLEEINKAMKNPQGIDMKNLNVKPGTTVDFAIVFENPPEEKMSEFTVGPVSSSPGS